MNTNLHTHRSVAFVKPIDQRGRAWKPDPITNQFRFIMRMAYACSERDVPYVLTWGLTDGVMAATITATGNIPMPKPLPKAPTLKIVADWKPSIFESVYRLEAYGDPNKGKRPGFVIEHSSGLSLVHPSSDGELGGDDEDIRKKWFVIHTRSGLGFGVELDFRRAVSKLNPEFRKAGYTVQAEYSKGFDKDSAIRRLAELDRVA